jgi:hypothetical protein
VIPERPLRLGRAERVVDPKAQPERLSEPQRLFEEGRRVGVQVTGRAPVHGLAGEVLRSRIGETDIDVECRRDDFNQGHRR